MDPHRLRLVLFAVIGLGICAVIGYRRSRERELPPGDPTAMAAPVEPSGRCLELLEPKGPVACPYSGEPSPSPSPDFAQRFEAGNPCVAVGRLNVTSGRLVATDPLVNIERKPFSRSIPPGKYPVFLTIDKAEQAIAFALLKLGEGRPIRWEKAEPGPGYFVDAGVGCFADAATGDLIRAKQARSPEDWLFAAMKPVGPGEGVNVCVDPASGANLIAFHSGIGDGTYPSYFGFDAAGAAVALVTDFEIVDLGAGRHPWLEGLRPSARP